MIAFPPEPGDATKPRASAGALTRAFFAPGGALERAFGRAERRFETRPQQRAMAEAIADAIDEERHLVVEAGTGVGKSFAYLAPLALTALERSVRVAVSTYTIALQEQLVNKDIPFLQGETGLRFKAVLIKGRSNYLCRRRLARALHSAPQLYDSAETRALEALRLWADHAVEGTIQELREEPPYEVWHAVCAEHGNCLGKKCASYERCFLMRARAEVRDAHLMVVNHHLLFADLALRAQGAAMLPHHEALVLDEAHMAEAAASEHLGIRLSPYAFEHWMRRLYVSESNRGLFALLRHSQGAHAVDALRSETARFFNAVDAWADWKENALQRTVNAPPDWPRDLGDATYRVVTELDRVIEDIEDEDLRSELKAARRRGAEMGQALSSFLEQNLEDQVYWIEREGRRRPRTVLHSAPVEVAPILAQTLFAPMKTVVMTSATLAVADDLNYFARRIGVGEGPWLRLGSPFDYARQMRIVVARHLPEPNAAAFVDRVAEAIAYFARRTRGRAFVLFTSAATLRQVAAKVEPVLRADGLELIGQHMGLARTTMLERFRERPGMVLFGLDTFWMGVDVPGEALSNVMIVRLPFAVPDHPLTRARMDRIRANGGDPFRDFSLPEAVLKFRQGVGRLIRSADDEGLIVILDSRVVTRGYGRLFLRSIPECPLEVMDAGDAAVA